MPPGSPVTSSPACLRANSGAPSPACGWRSSACAGDLQHHGIGTLLLDALANWARRHGIRDLRTQAAWNDHDMLRWLDAMGFTLAPNHIVDCAVAGGQYTAGA